MDLRQVVIMASSSGGVKGGGGRANIVADWVGIHAAVGRAW